MKKIPRTEEEWRKVLSLEQFRVLRKKGTEFAFSGSLLKENRMGDFICAACGSVLFSSDTKFDSGTGWPSFYDAKMSNVELKKDFSHGMIRTEVVCKRCKSHLD